jgi:hypothetical protein
MRPWRHFDRELSARAQPSGRFAVDLDPVATHRVLPGAPSKEDQPTLCRLSLLVALGHLVDGSILWTDLTGRAYRNRLMISFMISFVPP